MKCLLKVWISRERVPLLISGGFGLLASLFYFTAGYLSPDGRLAAWYFIYHVSLPASWVANYITCNLDGFIPDWLFGFLYVAGIIVAGMLWFFFIARLVRHFLAKPEE